jgi:NADH-quinone oxidoreductase subunit B
MDNEKISLPEYDIPADLEHAIAVTTLDRLYNWGRRSSVWPLMFGLACCAIEMIAAQTARYDMARFGMEVMRPTPRQADLLLVSGTVTKKMVPAIVRLYNQMPEPKYVVAMGACASGGGPFKEGYNVVAGIDKFLPVDVYIPGCPPTPQALIAGMIKLQEKIDKQSIKKAIWYNKKKQDSNYVPVPILGPDLIDPRRNAEIKVAAAKSNENTQNVQHDAHAAKEG